MGSYGTQNHDTQSAESQETELIPAICHFHAGVCATCYTKENSLGKLLRCGQCQLVSYCSKECQKKDWKFHRFLCTVNKIHDSKNVFGTAKEMLANPGGVDWFELRSSLSVAAGINLGRPLTVRESEILLYPKVCEICKESDAALLSSCADCFSVFYCGDSHRSLDEACHKIWCAQYRLCLECDTYEALNGIKDLPFPTDVEIVYSKLPENLKTLLDPQLKVDKTLDERFVTMICERLSYPLSLLYALENITIGQDLNLIENLTSLKVHIIGAKSSTELLGLIRWEYMLHRLPSLKSFHVVFVGPELMSWPNCETEDIGDKHCIEDSGMTRCPDCQEKDRLVIYEMATMTYHEYADTTHYSQPDAIVSFNCGFHEHVNQEKDTWNETLELISQTSVPLIFTSYTKQEATKDLDAVKKASDAFKIVMETRLNPFKASKPVRCPEREGGEQLFVYNQFLTVVRGNTNSSS